MSERASIYEKISTLQERLRKSEHDRLQLEQQFTILMRSCREKKEARLTKLRKQYEDFLLVDQTRRERNEQIMETLNRAEQQISVLNAKSQRLNILRQHYEKALQKRYPKLQLRDIIKNEMMKIPPENLDFLKYKSQIPSPTTYHSDSLKNDFQKSNFNHLKFERKEFISSYEKEIKSDIESHLKRAQENIQVPRTLDFVDIKSNGSSQFEQEIELEQNTSGDLLNITLSEDTNPQVQNKYLPPSHIDDSEENKRDSQLIPNIQTLDSVQLINQERENITKINSPLVENTLNLQSKHSLNKNISLQENPIHLQKSIEQVKPDLEPNEITMGASNKPQNEPYGNELKTSEFKFDDQNKVESSNQYLESIPTHFNNKQPISDQQAYVDYETPQQDDQYYEDYNQNNNIFQTDQANIENQAFEEYPKFQEYDSQVDYQQEVPQNNQEYLNYPQGEEQIYDPNLDQQIYYPQETNYTDDGQYYEQYDNNGTGQQQNYNQEYIEPKEGEIISEHHQKPFQETTTIPQVENSSDNYKNPVEYNQTLYPNETVQQQNYNQKYVEPKEDEIISEHHQTPFQETTIRPEVENSSDNYKNPVEYNQTLYPDGTVQQKNYNHEYIKPKDSEIITDNHQAPFPETTSFPEVDNNSDNYKNPVEYNQTQYSNENEQEQNYIQQYNEPKDGEVIFDHQQTPFQETTTFPEVDNSGHYQNPIEYNQTPEVYSSLIPTGQNEQLREEISSTSYQNEFQENVEHISEFEEVNNPSANENYLEISQPASEYKDRIDENQYLTDDNKKNPLEKENLRQINNTVNERVEKKPELVTNLEANFQDETDTVTESSSDFWDLGSVQKQSTNNTTVLDSNQDKEKEEKTFQKEEVRDYNTKEIVSNENVPAKSLQMCESSSESSDFPKPSSDLTAQLSKLNIEIAKPPSPKVLEQIESDSDIKEKEIPGQEIEDSDFDFSIEHPAPNN